MLFQKRIFITFLILVISMLTLSECSEVPENAGSTNK
jgi:hypothetical protein